MMNSDQTTQPATTSPISRYLIGLYALAALVIIFLLCSTISCP
jgi:hypothetical protein